MLAAVEQALVELESLALADKNVAACIERLRNRIYGVLGDDLRGQRRGSIDGGVLGNQP